MGGGEDEDDPAEGSQLERARAQPGTCSIHSNGYFTFSSHPSSHFIRVRIVTSWCRHGLLGTLNMSKPVTPTDYGATKLAPGRALWVLKAWMLHGAAEDGFCNMRPSGRRLVAAESSHMQKGTTAECPGLPRTTGHALTDADIRNLALAALA